MKSSHTSGPWAFCKDTLCQARGNYLHLGKWTESPGLGKAAEANKRLIAAAPALLEALRVVSDDLRDLLLQRMSPEMAQALPSLEAARAAIRQAAGQE